MNKGLWEKVKWGKTRSSDVAESYTPSSSQMNQEFTYATVIVKTIVCVAQNVLRKFQIFRLTSAPEQHYS